MQSSRAVAEVLLEAESLSRSYAGARVVDIDSLVIRRREVLVLLGPNGAGKSTLMRLLTGLEPADAGVIRFRGRAVKSGDPELRRAVVAVLQRPYLWRGTVEQNVAFGLKARRVAVQDRRARVEAALELLGIGALASAPVNTLSGGEAQRVALARALVLEPEILFLDEPTADLDVTARRRLLTDLERIVRQSARAIVLITHDPGEAFLLADRVVVMERGRVAQSGTPAEIFEAPATEFVASFTGAEFMLNGVVVEIEEGTMIVRLAAGQLVEAAGTGQVGQHVRLGYRPEDVVVALPQASATSARNRFPARVARLRALGGLIRLRLEADGLALEALITRHALDDLGLGVGTPVEAQIKATALHVFPA